MGRSDGFVIYGYKIPYNERKKEHEEIAWRATTNGKKEGVGFFLTADSDDWYFLIADYSTYRSIYGGFLGKIPHDDDSIIQFAKDHEVRIDPKKIGWYFLRAEFY